MTEEQKGDKPKNPLEELKQVTDNLKYNGEKTKDFGDQFSKRGQFMVDFAVAVSDVLPHLPAATDIESLIDDLNAYDQQAGRLTSGLQDLERNVIPSTDSTAGLAAISITGTFSNIFAEYGNEENLDLVTQSVIQNLFAVTGRAANAKQAEELIKKLNLDVARPGKQSPLELFRTAHAAFEKPVTKMNPASTSLIPMRECLRLIIDELLKRGHRQRKTHSEEAKIKFIGEKLKRDTIMPETIDSLAQKWQNDILDRGLSSAKEAAISRQEWSLRLQRATQFLISLLSALDPSKM